MTLRSVLFVPGSESDCFDAVQTTTADLVVLDVEHAENPLGEGAAGRRVQEVLDHSTTLSPRLAVRIHELDTEAGLADLRTLRSLESPPEIVVVPEVENPEELALVDEAIAGSGSDLFPLVETPQGVFNAAAIASATPSVAAIGFGPSDFCSQMGLSDVPNPDLSVPRYLVSMAAHGAGIIPVDMPNLQAVDDDDRTRTEAKTARAMGYEAKIGITESQIPIVNDVFSEDC